MVNCSNYCKQKPFHLGIYKVFFLLAPCKTAYAVKGRKAFKMASQTYSTIDLTDDDLETEETFDSIDFQFVDCSSSTPRTTPTSSKILTLSKPQFASPVLTSVSKNAKPLIQILQNKQVNMVKPMVSSAPVYPSNVVKDIVPKFIKIKHFNQLKPYSFYDEDLQLVDSNLKTNTSNKIIEAPSSENSEMKSVSQTMASQIKIHNNIILSPPKLVPISKTSNTLKSSGLKVSSSKVKNTLIEDMNNHKTSIQQKIASLSSKKSTSKILTVTKPENKKHTPNILKIQSRKDSQPQNTHFIKIPPELIPIINNSKGPVILDIPGVGPLIFNNDGNKTSGLSNDIQSSTSDSGVIKPFSLNFQDILHSHAEPQTQPSAVERVPPYNALGDKRYCWVEVRNRKIDIEGFTYSDRLGFYKSEQVRARRCDSNLRKHIIRLEQKFSTSFDEYKKWKVTRKNKSRLSLENVRLVEIDRIKSGFRNSSKKINNDKYRNLDAIEIEVADESTDSASDDDMVTEENELLLTKKVVFLKENKKSRGKRKLSHQKIKQRKRERYAQKKNLTAAKGPLNLSPKLQEYIKRLNIRPCFVEMERNHVVENTYKRRSNLATNPQKSVSPKYTDILNIFNERIINSIETFNHQVSRAKPILIINERQVTENLCFSDLFTKNNVIFCVRKNYQFPTHLFRHENFISGIELGYIKLVNYSVLCEHLSGAEEFLKEELV